MGGFGDSWSGFVNGIANAFSSWDGFTDALAAAEQSILNLNSAGLEFDPAGNAAKWDLNNAAMAEP